MPHWRGYVNKSKGNEHVRVIDVVADDRTAAADLIAKDVKRGETVGEIVRLKPSHPDADGTPPDTDGTQ